MKKFIYKSLIALGALVLSTATSCVGDLDLEPNDPNSTGQIADSEALLGILNKCYSCLAVSGQGGPNGASDVDGLDGGTGQYTRAWFMMNEFTTDESKWIWKDVGVAELNTNSWDASTATIYGTYSRFYVHISICNDFLKNAGDSEDAQLMKLEARTLRALSYFNAIDIFGNASFIDENAEVGANPVQKTRRELYDWLTAELEDIVAQFKAKNRPVNYGRVGIDGAEALLARLYLNAKVYTDGAVDGYAKCAEHCENIIARHQGGGFEGSGLANHYLYLFCGNNEDYMPGGSNSAENEILWGIPYDSEFVQPYGGTMFLIAAAIKNMDRTEPSDPYMSMLDYGISSQWGCMHATASFADKFATDDPSNDVRWSMWCREANGFKKENTNFSEFTDGYAIIKFTNLKKGTNGEWSPENGGIYDATGSKAAVTTSFPNTDLPLFRLADVYLMYAECNVVGHVGDASKALTYANYIRHRAGVKEWEAKDLTADNILDERARELYWECCRRTDLIRFGKYASGSYVWAFKGNVDAGAAFSEHRNLFPIPTNVLSAQPAFQPNPGY